MKGCAYYQRNYEEAFMCLILGPDKQNNTAAVLWCFHLSKIINQIVNYFWQDLKGALWQIFSLTNRNGLSLESRAVYRPGNHNAFRVIFTRNSFHYAHYAFGDDFTRNAITKLHISDRRGFHNCLPDSKFFNSCSIESFLTALRKNQ